MENHENQGNYAPMAVKDWLVTLIVSMIPIVGFIMLFVWGFGSGYNPSKSNWAKATLIFILIILALTILFSLIFGAGIFALFLGGGGAELMEN